MTTNRRLALVALLSAISLTAACSDSSFSTAPDLGKARNSGYTVIADRSKPPVDTMATTTTTTTATKTTTGK